MLPFGSPSYFRLLFFFLFFFVNRNDVESAKLTAASCNPKRSGAGQEDRRAVSVVSVSVFNHREAERESGRCGTLNYGVAFTRRTFLEM